tara:strand:- start:817 stop:1026 length:210 start_codon:yes stop_codon:yes gene_type:complete
MQTLSDFQNSGLSIQDIAQKVDDLASAINGLKEEIENGRFNSKCADSVLALMVDAHKNGHAHLLNLIRS